MGTTYSIVHIEKVKTYGALTAKCNHNLRKVDVDNADPELKYLNASLVETLIKKDDSVDLEKWKQLSQTWLHDTFDVAPDGKSNILSIEYHGDESGNGHIHAIVCPIDEQGHLNAKRFTGGYHSMADLQASNGERMKPPQGQK